FQSRQLIEHAIECRQRDSVELLKLHGQAVVDAWQDKITWIKDLDGCYVEYNDSMRGGGSLAAAGRIGKTDIELFGEVGKQDRRRDQLVIEANTPMELAERGSSGRVGVVRKFPIHGPENKLIGVGGIILRFQATDKPFKTRRA